MALLLAHMKITVFGATQGKIWQLALLHAVHVLVIYFPYTCHMHGGTSIFIAYIYLLYIQHAVIHCYCNVDAIDHWV